MILTQVPLEDTVVDFIRMIFEYNVQTILLLEDNVEHVSKHIPVKKLEYEGLFLIKIIVRTVQCSLNV